jgi:hypothetical protein
MEQTQNQSLDLATTQKQIQQGMDKLKAVQEKIESFREKSKSVAIADETDKAGYATAVEFLREVRGTRTSLEAERKMVTRPIAEFKKLVDDAYNRCTEDCAQIEAPIKARKDEIDAIKEEEKKRAEEQKAMALQSRISRLQEVGCTMIDGYWCIGNFSVGVVDIQNITDEMFQNNIMPVAEREYNAHLEAKRAEEEKIRLEKEAEIAKQKAMEAELESMRKAKLDLRKQLIESLAMPHSLTDDVVVAMSDESFMGAINQIKENHRLQKEKEAIEAEKQRIEAERIAKVNKRKELAPYAPFHALSEYTDEQFAEWVSAFEAEQVAAQRGEVLNIMGMAYSFQKEAYFYKEQFPVQLQALKTLSDVEFDSVVSSIKHNISEFNRIEAERERLETERIEAERIDAMSDKKKIQSFIESVQVEADKISLKKNQSKFLQLIENFKVSLNSF